MKSGDTDAEIQLLHENITHSKNQITNLHTSFRNTFREFSSHINKLQNRQIWITQYTPNDDDIAYLQILKDIELHLSRLNTLLATLCDIADKKQYWERVIAHGLGLVEELKD